MKKRRILPIIVILSTPLLVGKSFAWFFANDSVVNYFKTENAKIEILPEENFDENDGTKDNIVQWNGSSEIKEVKIKNTNNSNVDVLIRVNLTPRWVKRENNTPFAGDINLIDLVYDQVSNDLIIENKWIYGNDGYYYYKTKVSPGNSTEALLKEIKVKDNTKIPNEYSGKDFIVDVNAESIPADKNSFKSIWNIKDENNNIYKLLYEIV